MREIDLVEASPLPAVEIWPLLFGELLQGGGESIGQRLGMRILLQDLQQHANIGPGAEQVAEHRLGQLADPYLIDRGRRRIRGYSRVPFDQLAYHRGLLRR